MAIITGQKAIEKAIDSIKGRGARLDTDIQNAGLAVLLHASEHGDTTLCDRLFNAMPKGARRLALVEWVLAFGQVRVLTQKTDAARLKAGHVFGMDRTKVLNIAGAEAKPWHEMRKEAAPATAFDVQAQVKSLLTRLQAAKSAGLELRGESEAKAMLESFLHGDATQDAQTTQEA